MALLTDSVEIISKFCITLLCACYRKRTHQLTLIFKIVTAKYVFIPVLQALEDIWITEKELKERKLPNKQTSILCPGHLGDKIPLYFTLQRHRGLCKV